MQVIAERLRHLPPVTIYEPEYVKPLQEAGDAEELKIEQHGDYWLVTGKWLVRLVNDVNFTDYESRMYFLTGSCANAACLSAWKPWGSKMATPSAWRTTNSRTKK